VYFQGPRVVTGSDGEFVFSSVLPGEYAVQAHPRVLDAEQILTNFSAADVDKIDEDFEVAFGPGGREFSAGAVFTVSAGQSLNAGTLKLRKTDYYRVRLSLSSANCPSGESAAIQLERSPDSTVRLN